MNLIANRSIPPVAIGGIGGSGTRVMASFLRHLNYYIGSDLNEANDNLWFTLLFKRTELMEVAEATRRAALEEAVRVFGTAMLGTGGLAADQVDLVLSLAAKSRPQHSEAWLRQRAESFLLRAQCPRVAEQWAWKEPNTHIFIEYLIGLLPGLKYVHVIRNGLDMAFSQNQNQLELWGRYYFHTENYQINPHWSLKYWCLVHRRIADLAERLPETCLIVSYDHMCASPREVIHKLLDFLEIPADESIIETLVTLVQPARSIGRHVHCSNDQFDPEDIAYVRSLGLITPKPA